MAARGSMQLTAGVCGPTGLLHGLPWAFAAPGLSLSPFWQLNSTNTNCLNRASFYLALGIAAMAPGRLRVNHGQTEPALQENIPCKLLHLPAGHNGAVRARGLGTGIK